MHERSGDTDGVIRIRRSAWVLVPSRAVGSVFAPTSRGGRRPRRLLETGKPWAQCARPPGGFARRTAFEAANREESRSDRRVSLKLQREAPQMPLSRGGDRCRDRGSRVARRNLGPRIERVHVTNARTMFSRGIYQFLNWTGPVSSPSKGRNSDLYRRCRWAIAGWALRGGIRSASVRDDTLGKASSSHKYVRSRTPPGTTTITFSPRSVDAPSGEHWHISSGLPLLVCLHR